MTNKNVPGERHRVKFEKQIDPESCGAACASMVLDAIRVDHPAQYLLLEEIEGQATKDNGIDHQELGFKSGWIAEDSELLQ